MGRFHDGGADVGIFIPIKASVAKVRTVVTGSRVKARSKLETSAPLDMPSYGSVQSASSPSIRALKTMQKLFTPSRTRMPFRRRSGSGVAAFACWLMLVSAS